MREVKFRGYAVEEMVGTRWIYGTGIHRTVFTDEFAKECGETGETFVWSDSGWVQVQDESVGQYTGLKDKDGVEIFEGDVVKREFEIWKTEWAGTIEGYDLGPVGSEVVESGYFIGVVHLRPTEGYVLNKCGKFNDDGELVEKKSGVKLYAKQAEVIGNIYEHSHLLKKE